MGSILEEYEIEQSGRNLLSRFIALDWPAEDVMSLSLTEQNRCYAAIRPYLRTDDIYHMPVVTYSLATREVEEVSIEPRVSPPFVYICITREAILLSQFHLARAKRAILQVYSPHLLAYTNKQLA